MLNVRRFAHEEFTSNTYLLSDTIFKEDLFLIDIGSSNEVLETLTANQKIKGIFLTHSHYDHIYGINDILEAFPECVIYCSEYAREGLYSEKLNLSFYHEHPIVLQSDNTTLIGDDMMFELFSGCELKVIETKGHNEGSVSFKIDTALFTGDSLIPNTPVVTKLKSGNKEEAIRSIVKIQRLSLPTDTIYPGHGMECKVADMNWEFYLNNVRN